MSEGVRWRRRRGGGRGEEEKKMRPGGCVWKVEVSRAAGRSGFPPSWPHHRMHLPLCVLRDTVEGPPHWNGGGTHNRSIINRYNRYNK